MVIQMRPVSLPVPEEGATGAMRAPPVLGRADGRGISVLTEVGEACDTPVEVGNGVFTSTVAVSSITMVGIVTVDVLFDVAVDVAVETGVRTVPVGATTVNVARATVAGIVAVIDTKVGVTLDTARVTVAPGGIVGVTGTPVGGVVPVAVAAGGGGVGAQLREKLFVSSVTAPLRANALPDTVTPVFAVMLVRARMLPMKLVFTPSVAELPTCQ